MGLCISLRRYRELEPKFKELHPNVDADELVLYANFFEIAGALTGNKMTTDEMIALEVIMKDLLHGKIPKYMLHVPANDRIRAQISLMQQLPFAKSLTKEEMQRFAFCVVYAHFIQSYDEQNDKMISGLNDFTSADKIMAEYELLQKINPGMFIQPRKTPTGPFGYSKGNPILTTAVPMAYIYLDSLVYPDAKEVSYNRVGTTRGVDGHILDIYEIKVTIKHWFSSDVKNFTVYIDSYADTNSTDAPEGFKLEP